MIEGSFIDIKVLSKEQIIKKVNAYLESLVKRNMYISYIQFQPRSFIYFMVGENKKEALDYLFRLVEIPVRDLANDIISGELYMAQREGWRIFHSRVINDDGEPIDFSMFLVKSREVMIR